MGATTAAARINNNPATHHPTPKITAQRVESRPRWNNTSRPDTANSAAISPSGLTSSAKYGARSPAAKTVTSAMLTMSRRQAAADDGAISSASAGMAGNT